MRQVFAAFGETLSEAEVTEFCDGHQGYAEPFFARLGAGTTDSFDYSDFEEATFVHDMNEPIPPDHRERYSLVLDSGSLEHIFNFPCAIRNCMEMVRPGGHFVSITPANNFFGHGFYQFSPELYFTVLSAENGFEMKTMMAFEETANAVWYDVRRPQDVRERVTLLNAEPVYLCLIAQRTAVKPIFQRTPQQSDYLVRWNGDSAPPAAPDGPAPKRPLPIRLAKLVLPFGVRRSIRRAFERPAPPIKPGFDPKFFRRIGPGPGGPPGAPDRA
jgi:SAM-dependent methyltransferase